MVMKRLIIILFVLMATLPASVIAQQRAGDDVEVLRAKVIEVVEERRQVVPGTNTEQLVQKLHFEITRGIHRGKRYGLTNDYIRLEEGDEFYLNFSLTDDGSEIFSVRDLDRTKSIALFVLLFIIVVIALGGKQGWRSLLSLFGGIFIVLYVLVPGLIEGYPPVLMSILVAALILFVAIFFTHGFNKESVVAFSGTMMSVVITSFLAFVAVNMLRFTGFATDAAIYLNFETDGILDFQGLLLGSIIIGVLGVLDDIAVTQAAVVSELHKTNPNQDRIDIYNRAMRVGREHVGALVNTLVLAYTSAALPLLLFFAVTESEWLHVLNQEIVSGEVIRMIVGSIGLIMTVPIVTILAVFTLAANRSEENAEQTGKDEPEKKHSHVHVHHMHTKIEKRKS